MKIVTDKRILRQVSEPVLISEQTEFVTDLVSKLKEANNHAWTDGCGLAAIQLGVAKRVAWLTIDGKELLLVNPKIVSYSDKRDVLSEGCLSIPRVHTMVRRSQTIDVILNGFTGEVTTVHGFTARVIQHEIDHMNGILNIDKKFKATSQDKKKKRRKK